jgi:hypothetical protein
MRLPGDVDIGFAEEQPMRNNRVKEALLRLNGFIGH